jgi:GxxExxY protein
MNTGNNHRGEDNNWITSKIIGAAMRVHTALGPGLLESSYRECLYHELKKKENLKVEKELKMPLVYEEVDLDVGYRIDLLVENAVVIELKAVEALNDVHLAQILTYRKLGDFKTGLLINFNVALLKQGIRRVINENKPAIKKGLDQTLKNEYPIITT